MLFFGGVGEHHAGGGGIAVAEAPRQGGTDVNGVANLEFILVIPELNAAERHGGKPVRAQVVGKMHFHRSASVRTGRGERLKQRQGIEILALLDFGRAPALKIGDFVSNGPQQKPAAVVAHHAVGEMIFGIEVFQRIGHMVAD